MVIAGLAADVARQLLTARPRGSVVGGGNLRTLDLERSIVEAAGEAKGHRPPAPSG
jgi:hypothetical protein